MMTTGRGARDRRFSVVAVEAQGGRSAFDGNHSSDIVSWLIPFPGTRWAGLDEDQMDQLMAWTEAGHLAWVVFPVDNP